MSFKLLSSTHVALYRLSGGRLGTRAFGNSILLLTVKGRKTGKQRTTPLLYFRNADNLLVVASKGGHPKHPEWYNNLVASPEVMVQIGHEKLPMRAATATEDEKSRLWPEIVRAYKGYGEYQRKTTRNIPVVILKKR